MANSEKQSNEIKKWRFLFGLNFNRMMHILLEEKCSGKLIGTQNNAAIVLSPRERSIKSVLTEAD
jgi:hypothetical protein